MKILDEGHLYELEEISHDGVSIPGKQILKFIKRFRGDENQNGILNQELLRVLINRVIFLDKEIPWSGNQEILKHLRLVLGLHESRALLRKIEKNQLFPENIIVGKDGHFKIE